MFSFPLSITGQLRLRGIGVFSTFALLAGAFGQVNVTTYQYDNFRTGNNSAETILKPSNVNSSKFGLLYSQPVDGYVYAQPLYLQNVDIPGKGLHDVVFVATENNSLYAFDAQGDAGTDAEPLWHVNFGTPVSDSDIFGVSDIFPQVGITATPVIAPANPSVSGSTPTLYVVSKSKTVDGSGNATFYQKLHAIDVTTGFEKTGSPVEIQATVKGIGDGSINGLVTFSPLYQQERPALLLVPGTNGGAGTVFLSFGSHGDSPPYHGWIFAYNATTLARVGVINTSPNASNDPSGWPLAGGSIWQSGGGLSSDGSSIYCVTGNGAFDPSNGSYGDSVLRIPMSTFQVADYFTPNDQEALNDGDNDLGSSEAILLPPAAGSAQKPNLLVCCGKEGTIYLLNRENLGKYNATDNVVQELYERQNGVWGSPCYFNGSVYYGPTYGEIRQYPVREATFFGGGESSSTPETFEFPGPTPCVSSDGNQNGILWAIQTDAWSYGGPGVLHAYAASNLNTEFYNSSTTNGRDTLDGAVKFSVPTVANGRVYVGTADSVSVFGLGQWAATPTVTPASGSYTNSVKVTVTDTTPNAQIYYTTDGSLPSRTSKLYTGPVTFTTSVTFQARAYAPNYSGSALAQAYYLINPVIGTGTGLTGNYYANYDWTGSNAPPTGTPTDSEVDPVINFNWDGNPPGNPAFTNIGGSNWAASWTGQIQAECTGTYTFYMDSNNGVDLTVNGQQIINDWSYQGANMVSGTINLVSGQKYTIVADYFQVGGNSFLQLFWSTPGISMEIVPQTQLYP
jgi:hypothetical protein